jgi:hypothetical protein
MIDTPQTATYSWKKTIPQVIALLFFLAAGIFFARAKWDQRELDQSANARIVREQQALISEIGEFLILPNDETPTIATVTDKRKLAKQELFKEAENGDVLLAYPIAKKLILYRPENHIIITVATITDEK